MKRLIKYNSIEQFSSIVRNISHSARYLGYNEETQEPIYDTEGKLPILKANGSEKIHGTNAAVSYSEPDGFWVQSKGNIITPEKDNAGCAASAYVNEDVWMELIMNLKEEYEIDLDKYIITIFYEWAGGNIQTKSAVSGLEKRSIIFHHFKVSPLEPQLSNDGSEVGAVWKETKINGICEGDITWIDNQERNIFNIMNFPTVEVEIDFDRPDIAQNKMIELVKKFEENSPVGQYFGKESNILEGFVFTFIYKDVLHKFKVKGDKHAKGSGEVKTLKPVDEALEQKKRDFVNNFACKEWRLSQMYDEVFDTLNGGIGDRRRTGDYIKAVMKDIIKEELLEMTNQGLDPKQIGGLVSKVAKTYLFSRIEKEVGL